MEGHSHLLPWGFSQRAQRILLLNKDNRRPGAKQATVHIVDKVWVIGQLLLKRWSRAVWTSNSPLFIRCLLQGLGFVFLYFLLASGVTQQSCPGPIFSLSFSIFFPGLSVLVSVYTPATTSHLTRVFTHPYTCGDLRRQEVGCFHSTLNESESEVAQSHPTLRPHGH